MFVHSCSLKCRFDHTYALFPSEGMLSSNHPSPLKPNHRPMQAYLSYKSPISFFNLVLVLSPPGHPAPISRRFEPGDLGVVVMKRDIFMHQRDTGPCIALCIVCMMHTRCCTTLKHTHSLSARPLRVLSYPSITDFFIYIKTSVYLSIS